MNLVKLQNIKKVYFGYGELARAFDISKASARVVASRYTKMGLLVRIKRNLYMRRETWNAATRETKFMVANLGETPSYISLMTALGYYGITTQMQREFFESIAIQRSKTISVLETVFRYSKISSDLYFGFIKKDDFFIALPEKALLDAVYLASYGRYSLDFSSIDPEKINKSEIEKLSRPYPQRSLRMLRTYGYLESA